MSKIRAHVLVCAGTGCTSSGSEKILTQLEKELAAHNLQDEIKIVKTGCFGLCALGPIMVVYPEGAFYSHITANDVTAVSYTHLDVYKRQAPAKVLNQCTNAKS